MEHREKRSSYHHPKFFSGSCYVEEVVSKMVIQDSISEPISEFFLPQSDNNFESEDETDSNYDLCEISGNHMFSFIY